MLATEPVQETSQESFKRKLDLFLRTRDSTLLQFINFLKLYYR
ncbi:unnamed protein product [Schistosoma margrebowiei]|uniref:Uncharacterized protein n=1 Tax=Schistosoma margrebowiei TaxID=48269 RepID=A0A3P8DW82_9TREM|nr:unnamed protein product [Schistosoma margrebowiei]